MCCTRRGAALRVLVSCLPPASVCLEVPLDAIAPLTFQTTVFCVVAMHLVLCAPRRSTTRASSANRCISHWQFACCTCGVVLLRRWKAAPSTSQSILRSCRREICLELPLGAHLRTLLLDRSRMESRGSLAPGACVVHALCVR